MRRKCKSAPNANPGLEVRRQIGRPLQRIGLLNIFAHASSFETVLVRLSYGNPLTSYDILPFGGDSVPSVPMYRSKLQIRNTTKRNVANPARVFTCKDAHHIAPYPLPQLFHLHLNISPRN